MDRSLQSYDVQLQSSISIGVSNRWVNDGGRGWRAAGARLLVRFKQRWSSMWYVASSWFMQTVMRKGADLAFQFMMLVDVLAVSERWLLALHSIPCSWVTMVERDRASRSGLLCSPWLWLPSRSFGLPVSLSACLAQETLGTWITARPKPCGRTASAALWSHFAYWVCMRSRRAGLERSGVGPWRGAGEGEDWSLQKSRTGVDWGWSWK